MDGLKRFGMQAGWTLCIAFLFVLPASTNYRLKGYGFGSGGEENMTSGGYAVDGLTGEAGAGKLTGSSYGIGAGLMFEQQANVPPAPTFSNDTGSLYNKLKLTISTGDNPTDAKFAVAISADDFVSTQYVQSDMTVGSSLGTEDYMTYAAWGGSSGSTVIGLSPNTAYKVKVKVMQGKFTETGYGPTASASTVGPQLSFDVDVSASDAETSSPYTLDLGNLPAGTVVTAAQKIWVDLSTNGTSGGKVYVSSQNGGLHSQTVNSTIASASGNLTALSSGFGLQGSTATQSSGGPLSFLSPYDQSGDTVGISDSTVREILSASGPISSGRGSVLVKAKSSSVTPAAGDYQEIITVVASGAF